MVGRTALQDEALVAIAALDIALLVDLQIDARMTECRRDLRRAIAGDARAVGIGDFGSLWVGRGHGRALATAFRSNNPAPGTVCPLARPRRFCAACVRSSLFFGR